LLWFGGQADQAGEPTTQPNARVSNAATLPTPRAGLVAAARHAWFIETFPRDANRLVRVAHHGRRAPRQQAHAVPQAVRSQLA
jgi:hypothetical protein